jgi:hypothetical protein
VVKGERESSRVMGPWRYLLLTSPSILSRESSTQTRYVFICSSFALNDGLLKSWQTPVFYYYYYYYYYHYYYY